VSSEKYWERLLYRVFFERDPDDAELNAKIRKVIMQAARERDEALTAAKGARSVGDLVRQRRLSYRIEIDELAQYTGVEVRRLLELEKGTVPPWSLNVAQFVRLIAELGIPVASTIALIEREEFRFSGCAVPAHTRALTRRKAKRRNLTEDASLRLEAKVWEKKKREFLEHLRRFIE
jgi:transcriptional regulator with XRE-family HTH domain